MPGAGGLCTSAARHRHRVRVPCRHITEALAGRRCTPRRRSVPALPLLTGFARRCRQPKLPGSASRIVVLIVAATLTDIPMPCMALALGPLGPLGERHPPTPKPGWRMNMTVVPWYGLAALQAEVGDLFEGQGGDPVAQRAQRVLQVTRIDHPEVGEPEVIQYHMH